MKLYIYTNHSPRAQQKTDYCVVYKEEKDVDFLNAWQSVKRKLVESIFGYAPTPREIICVYNWPQSTDYKLRPRG